ncbi:MAG: ABC transporter ATP-binding protein [Lachnospiraceae bacterium]
MNMENEKQTAIELRHVTKRYKLFKDDKQRLHAVFNKRIQPKIKLAINDMSFEVKKGESVALFGRNGAGKSTLLKMITGVIYPTSGEIIVNGRVSALLELTAGFDPDFTGRENIYFRGQLMGIPDEEIKKLEANIVEFADIGDYMDQPVRTYSSGMKARLGFAINANVEPEILIVDEALSVGDKAFRLKCNRKIKEILSTGEVTFLFVTHTTSVAMDFCERGIVLKDGKILYDDEVEKAADYYEKMVDAEIEAAGKKKTSKKKSIMQM